MNVKTKTYIILGFILFLACGGLILGSNFYYWTPVEENELGVQFRAGELYNIVGSGMQSDFGLWINMEIVKLQAIPFDVEDQEIVTKDKARIGLRVSGDIFRTQDHGFIKDNWARYKHLFVSDEAAIAQVNDFALQAMKSCVGDNNFTDAIIGSGRDEQKNCITNGIDVLSNKVGLEVKNIVIPNVILSPEVQGLLDEIQKDSLNEQKAVQKAKTYKAEALRDAAQEEGEIVVEQARIQEQARQETQLTLINIDKIVAQESVIKSQLSKDLTSVKAEEELANAQLSLDLNVSLQELEIVKVNTEIARLKAEMKNADLSVLIDLYGADTYAQMLIAQSVANSWSNTEKAIIPSGTTSFSAYGLDNVSPLLRLEEMEDE